MLGNNVYYSLTDNSRWADLLKEMKQQTDLNAKFAQPKIDFKSLFLSYHTASTHSGYWSICRGQFVTQRLTTGNHPADCNVTLSTVSRQ